MRRNVIIGWRSRRRNAGEGAGLVAKKEVKTDARNEAATRGLEESAAKEREKRVWSGREEVVLSLLGSAAAAGLGGPLWTTF